ncbi:predicted protein [Nematostella vectensis]|uniref:Translin-associated protein X n=1 Tax=Nematostella vectensis TaxID=45351 RepID=A7SW58_NEMVE|nr:predicted protein [Nematostella vectensis]|eukprot:XP_001624181.1 predicted protein [Nematostella vectensis]
MADRSRKRKIETDKDSSEAKVANDSPVIAAFQQFQEELDLRHDKYERIVKSSRDLTIQSKRAIFNLHRIAGADNSEKIIHEVGRKLHEIKQYLKKIALELEGEDPFRFSRAYSPGLQEYIESLSFYYYLKNKTLVPFQEVVENCTFPAEDGKALKLEVPLPDYVLGIADLTGELMRFCMNSTANGDGDTPFTVCQFMREVHDELALLEYCCKDIGRKLGALKSSLYKVEHVCYTLQVRRSEFPQLNVADLLKCGSGMENIKMHDQ